MLRSSAMAASFKIVVNYRREDTAGHAGRLYDDLAERFGEDSVFMDIDAIPPGVDFAQAIEQAIGSAQAFLALIGPRWISCRATRPGHVAWNSPTTSSGSRSRPPSARRCS